MVIDGTPARIHPLPPALANQIAAGEVVERPASVVKELVENSLDAGARRVEVEVEEGGVRLLRVRDDGGGIHSEDLALALARHATSKLRTAEDLLRVGSLGFRGEALPSIASVSRLTLASRTAGEERGWQVRVDGGGPVEGPVPVAHPPGTTVEVRELFYNVPARRKFLKSRRTESGHVEEVARRLALARFDVGLRLRVDGREVLDARPAGDPAAEARRVAAVCGAAFAERALRLDLQWEGMRLSGWVGPAAEARSQADVQYLFLNGRPVRDRVLVHALREAYQDRVYPGRHPAYVLYLGVDPEEVDVNVHPTKQEVRFREPRLVHDFVARSIARVLEGSLEEPEARPAGDLLALAPGGTGRVGGVSWGGSPAGARLSATRVRSPDASYGRAVSGAAGRGVSEAWLRGRLPVGGAEAGPVRRPLAVAHGRFLLAQSSGRITLIDLAALAGHLARRGLEAALAGGDPPARPLLMPATVSVGPREAEAAEAHGGLCAALGLDLSRSGPAAVLVRGVPAAVHDADPAALAGAVLGALAVAGPSATPAVAVEAAVAVAARTPPTAPAALDAFLRAFEAVPVGEWPLGLARELTAGDLLALLTAPDAHPGR
jgi:DNA mismatch repair protein MutL